MLRGRGISHTTGGDIFVVGHERRTLRRIALIGALLGAFAVLAPAASADVTGTVTTTAGQPLYNVYVHATDALGAAAGSDYTDAAGSYQLYVSTFSPPASPLTVSYE